MAKLQHLPTRPRGNWAVAVRSVPSRCTRISRHVVRTASNGSSANHVSSPDGAKRGCALKLFGLLPSTRLPSPFVSLEYRNQRGNKLGCRLAVPLVRLNATTVLLRNLAHESCPGFEPLGGMEGLMSSLEAPGPDVGSLQAPSHAQGKPVDSDPLALSPLVRTRIAHV
jgi:hypothetical protein